MSKPKLPAHIDLLDLFCGTDPQKLIKLATANPSKVYVGVDKSPCEIKTQIPSNLHLVRQDALEFLRTRKYGERVGEVHIDYGLHFLPVAKRQELYWHARHLLVPSGVIRVTAYDYHREVPSELVEQELNANGLRVIATKSLSELGDTFESKYVQRALRETTPRWRSSRIVAVK